MKSCRIFRGWSFGIALVLGPLAGAQVGLEQPTLTHSAPRLGQVLTLRVADAPPLAAIEFYYAPAAGSLATPYGTLELERTSLRILGNGTTDAAGHWSTILSVPLAAGLAESEAHFQALVVDPSRVGARVFSQAAHLRLLGPRVYVGVGAGLAIVSAVRDEVVATVDYGVGDVGALYEGKPVFDANFATGAVMSTRTHLLFFDPFFGGAETMVRLPICSRLVFGDAARARVYVLETGSTLIPSGARLHVFDFGSQAEIAYLDLPHPAANQWCASADMAEAFVAEFEPARGRTAVRRIDLVNLVDRGAVPVGDAASRAFDDMTLAGGQLFVTTSTPFPPTGYTGWLTRVRFSGVTPITVVESFAQNRLPRIAAVPAVNRLLVSRFMPFVPSTGLFEASLSTPRTHQDIPLPWVYLVANDIAVEGSDAWFLDSGDNEPPGGTEPGRLYRLDMGTHAWTQYPRTWSFVGPRDMELVHDALVDKIYLANRGFGPPINVPPELFVIDRAHASEGHVVLAHSPEVLCGSTLD